MQIKSIALPREHGAWGYVLEPLALALLAFFSLKGLYLAIGALLAFLTHQPVRVFFSSRGSVPKAALFFILLYGSAALYFILLFAENTAPSASLPFLAAVLLMIVYLIMELSGKGKELLIRIMAPVAMDALAVSVLLVSGGQARQAPAFFVLLLSRSLPTTFYVRARLRSGGNGGYYNIQALLLHVLAFLLAAIFVYLGQIPFLSLAAVVLLLARTAHGLYFSKIKMAPKQVGIREFVYGILFVLISAAGYIFYI